MDEYIELLDSNGTPNEKKCLKSIAHKNGYFHASVHIWIYTKSGEVLIQKRKHNKDTFPNLWDISVAGHISFGENHKTSALRETQEEIGLTTSTDSLIYLGTSEHKNIHLSKGIIDHELHHIYLTELNADFNDLTIQEEEVAAIKLIDIFQLEKELNDPSTKENYVPHGEKYYSRIFEAIKKQMTL